MNKTKLLSNFFLLLLIATILSFSYNQYKRYKDEEAVKVYQELIQEEKDQIADSITVEPINISEEITEEKSILIDNKPITISDNKNIPLLNEIEDYTGWIKIENSKIDYPVVKGKDNEFYLDYNYKKEKSDAGAIFMDRRNLGNRYDKHTIIYGHNLKEGTMFTDLNKYLKEDFYKTNDLISFEDLYSNYQYKVISAYYISANDYTIPFELDEEIMNDLLERSIHESNYEYDSDDRFLTLATCNYILNNGRMIVHGVLVE
jgi:sortase B